MWRQRLALALSGSVGGGLTALLRAGADSSSPPRDLQRELNLIRARCLSSSTFRLRFGEAKIGFGARTFAF
jgi:hypothetical protein